MAIESSVLIPNTISLASVTQPVGRISDSVMRRMFKLPMRRNTLSLFRPTVLRITLIILKITYYAIFQCVIFLSYTENHCISLYIFDYYGFSWLVVLFFSKPKTIKFMH